MRTTEKLKGLQDAMMVLKAVQNDVRASGQPLVIGGVPYGAERLGRAFDTVDQIDTEVRFRQLYGHKHRPHIEGPPISSRIRSLLCRRR